MKELRRLLQKHDEDDHCKGHCAFCGVDEPGEGYIRCFECGHLYETKRDLRKAFRTELTEGVRFFRDQLHSKQPFWRSTPFGPSRVRYWWMLLTARAGRIHSCQHCSHNF